MGHCSIRTLAAPTWQPGPGVGGYLGILKHAEVGVHVKREVLVPIPLVQFGGLVELPLVGKHICEKQVIVGLSPLLPLLEKLEAQEMAPAAMAGSSLYKGSMLLFQVKPLGLPTGTSAWLLGCCVSHLGFWWECLTRKADIFSRGVKIKRDANFCLFNGNSSGLLSCIVFPGKNQRVRMVCAACSFVAPKISQVTGPGLLSCDS